jgi:hypothetical protein
LQCWLHKLLMWIYEYDVFSISLLWWVKLPVSLWKLHCCGIPYCQHYQSIIIAVFNKENTGNCGLWFFSRRICPVSYLEWAEEIIYGTIQDSNQLPTKNQILSHGAIPTVNAIINQILWAFKWFKLIKIFPSTLYNLTFIPLQNLSIPSWALPLHTIFRAENGRRYR